ncbi:MAG: hypothetical protein H6666_01715 [Ardenticatenaceae bacterium]|nr:hypothetical protein [Anaerolineales bacterium]MCB8916614.1 hypothetical protein [Ardenticatenaceae bacterium]
MIIELVRPKNALNLVAGLGSLMFEKLAGLPVAVEEVPEVHDDLTQINGIGPTFARRLNEAGIYSYRALAALTPETVKQITQARDWQGNPAGWIAQARLLAQ